MDRTAEHASPCQSARPAIWFEAIWKTFESKGKTVTALEDINLRVFRSQFVSIVGPSGCGKSTLLRLVSGLSYPDRGNVMFDGRRVEGINTELGYVSQNSNLFPWLTLSGNVEFGLLNKGYSREQRAQLVAEYIALVGLEGFEGHYPHQLSGGMAKRASIIRTMIYDPDVILMDEPFGPLDAQTRMILQADLLEIWGRDRKTILFVTHDLVEAIALSDIVVIMSKKPGQIKSVFNIPLARPRNVFEIHSQADFAETYARIWEIFKSEVSDRDAEPTPLEGEH